LGYHRDTNTQYNLLWVSEDWYYEDGSSVDDPYMDDE
jgi:hypothetical protein